MPPMPVFVGFGILTTLLQAAIVIDLVWLMIKLSRSTGRIRIEAESEVMSFSN